MVKEIYCKYCKRDVQLVKKKSSGVEIAMWILFSIITLGFGLGLWLLVRLFTPKTCCAICGSKIANSFEKPIFNKEGEIIDPMSKFLAWFRGEK